MKLSVLISPLDLSLHVVYLVLFLKISNHLLLLCFQLNFILQHQLSVCFLLKSPHALLLLLLLLQSFAFLYLCSSGCFNILDLIRPQTLEMIWHVSVACKLTSSSCWIFSHYITVVHIDDFKLVLSLLILSP